MVDRTCALFLLLLTTAATPLTPPPAAAQGGFLLLPLDIAAGPDSSATREPVDVGGVLFFVADELDTSGSFFNTRLWVSNGTEAGTVKLEKGGGVPDDPTELAAHAGALFFSGDGGLLLGQELWRSDGTLAGTVMVADINMGGGSSFPTNLASVGGQLFFAADDGNGDGKELWVSDGLPGGVTRQVADINPGPGSSIGRIATPIDVGGTLFFWADDGTHGFELWKSDGTAPGTMMVKDINTTSPGASSVPFDPNGVVIGSRRDRSFDPLVVGGTLFFTADDGINGVELWRSDGTPGGTTMVSNIHPTAGFGSDPAWLTEMGGTLYFTATEPVAGRELWKTDGFLTGTDRVADIFPGFPSARDVSFHDVIVEIDGWLYFAANGGPGQGGNALWKSNGTEMGTMRAVDLSPASDGFSPLNKLIVLNGSLFFAADDGTNGVELWQSDGTLARTARTDIRSGPGSSIALVTGPRGVDLATAGNRLFVPATGADDLGDELWVTSPVLPPGFDPSRSRPLGGDPPPDPLATDLQLGVLILPLINNILPFLPSGGRFAYLYQVSNQSFTLAVDVELDDLIDPGVAPISVSPECALLPGPTLECDLGNLAPGQVRSVYMEGFAPIVSVPTQFANFATVTSSTPDDNPLNDGAITLLSVQPEPPPPMGSADLAIFKLDALDPVLAGTEVSYDLVVVNNGPADATGVVVSDPLPAELAFASVSSTPPGLCMEATGTVTCDIGMLAKDARVDVRVVATLPLSTGAIENTATVAGNEPDHQPLNDSATERTTVSVPEPRPFALAIAAVATCAALAAPRNRRRRPGERGASSHRIHRPGTPAHTTAAPTTPTASAP